MDWSFAAALFAVLEAGRLLKGRLPPLCLSSTMSNILAIVGMTHGMGVEAFGFIFLYDFPDTIQVSQAARFRHTCCVCSNTKSSS
jgi:hypothetical protein